MAKRAGYLSPPRVMLLRLRPLIKRTSVAQHAKTQSRRGRPNAQASVGFVPGAKARSAHQSRGLASLVRVTWCFDCSPHGSAGSTGHAEAVVGFTCPKPAGRRCWVATAGDCTCYIFRMNTSSCVSATQRVKSSNSLSPSRLITPYFTPTYVQDVACYIFR